MNTIVCGVDGSPGAAQALRVASRLGESLGLRLVVAHVSRGERVGTSTPGGAERARDEAERLLDRVKEEAGVNGSADRRAEAGDPAAALARVAAEEAATLIVVGARTQGRRRRTLLSGLAAELNATAPCPVLVVPPPARR